MKCFQDGTEQSQVQSEHLIIVERVEKFDYKFFSNIHTHTFYSESGGKVENENERDEGCYSVWKWVSRDHFRCWSCCFFCCSPFLFIFFSFEQPKICRSWFFECSLDLNENSGHFSCVYSSVRKGLSFISARLLGCFHCSISRSSNKK